METTGGGGDTKFYTMQLLYKICFIYTSKAFFLFNAQYYAYFAWDFQEKKTIYRSFLFLKKYIYSAKHTHE